MADKTNAPLFITDSKGTLPVWVTLATALTIMFAVLIFTAAVPVKDTSTLRFIYVMGGLAQFLAAILFVLVFWRHVSKFTVVTQAIVVACVAATSWWGATQPLFTLFVVSLDRAQLEILTLSWMWELPGFAVLVLGAYVLAIARPLSYLKKPKSLYRHTLYFPTAMAVGILSMVVLGYLVGTSMLRLFADFPLIEGIKLTTLGFVSAIFMSIFFYYFGDSLMQTIRERLETKHKLRPKIRESYALKVFIMTSVISLGALLLIGMAVFQSYQVLTTRNAQRILESRIDGALSFISQQPNTKLDLQHFLITENTSVQSLALGQKYRDETLRPETVETIQTMRSGSIVDRRDNEVLISFFSHPTRDEKVIVAVPMSDFYPILFDSIRTYTLAAIFVLILATLTTTYYSTNLARTIRSLSSAVRGAKDSLKPFTFNTYTADELEDLSLAFQYYINQANELRAHLEDKVRQRTEALIEVEEEKRRLEVESAQKSTQLEHAMRKTAEDTAENLEEKVRERTAALQDAIQRLEEIDRVKSEFISLASHQLRTPLTGLRWAQHALLEDGDKNLTQDQQTIIQSSLDRILYMTGLVNELLNVNRIEDKEYQLDKKKVKVAAILRSVYEQHKESAELKKITLNFEVPSITPSLELDEDKMIMAIGNLVDNSLKYTLSGGTVTIRASFDKQRVTIWIEDTGIGIPQKDQYRAFSKFFRAQNAVALHTSGSGLGMYIARNIIDQHGGQIELESEVGKGTIFTILLPIEQATTKAKTPAMKGAITTLTTKQ